MNALVMNCSPVRNGATAEIAKIVSEQLQQKYDVKSICIDDYDIHFCKGCRSCHNTAKCVQKDDVDKVIEEYNWADIIVINFSLFFESAFYLVVINKNTIFLKNKKTSLLRLL